MCDEGVRSRSTSKERDTESGLDYFLARYYASSLGRFNSVDPGNAGSELGNPQLWNGYAYTGNNPLGYVDPDGLDRVKDIIQGIGIGLDNFVRNAGLPAFQFVDAPVETTAAVASGISAVAQDPGLIADAVVEGVENFQQADLRGKAAIATEATAVVATVAVGVGAASKSGGTIQTLGKVEAKAAATVTRGGENAAAAAGRQAHRELADRVAQKPGWQSEPRMVGADGKVHKPDVVTPGGRILELKPNTPSGRDAGQRQIRRYEEQLGMRGRVIYYEPEP